VVAACLAALGASPSVLGSASGAPSTWPYIAGTWETTSTDCPGVCGAQWTFSPVTPGEAPPYAYNIAMGGVGAGFYAHDVTIAANGTASFRETCDGCTGYSQIIVTFSTAKNQNTFSGTWQPFSPHSNAPGAPVEPGEAIGEISGKEIMAPTSDAPSGSSDWPAAKCKRIYQAWNRAHKHATRAQAKAEAHALDKQHDCHL
jgi:hypothetical protein